MNAEPIPMTSAITGYPVWSSTGGNRAVIEAARAALAQTDSPTLTIVLETAGSTYVGAGAIAVFAGDSRTGWLSGGCLEPEIARRAALAASNGCVEWMEVDTRDDETLFGGSAVGCRGRLRLALLPLRSMPAWEDLAASWLDRSGPMELSLSADGIIQCRVEGESACWQLPAKPVDWQPEAAAATGWQLTIAVPPSVVLFGAGPEAPVLLPLLRSMGWMTRLVECRERWLGSSQLADQFRPVSAARALQEQDTQPYAALVMHHNFELDLEALLALAECPPSFIGLLGPRRRREDLFRLLPETARLALMPNLHSPVGLDLGGRGPEAIALSIAAQLQSKLHGR